MNFLLENVIQATHSFLMTGQLQHQTRASQLKNCELSAEHLDLQFSRDLEEFSLLEEVLIC